MCNTIFLKESKGTCNELVYVKGQENTVLSLNAALSPASNAVDFIVSVFKSILLPQGYPESVSADYLSYQLWDTIQAFCSTITNTLATRAVLQGVGVGDVTASSVSAAITWIMKDGFGMLSRIMFAWISGTRLDGECKKWRLLADLMNDIAICIEIIILPYLENGNVLKVLCISSALKAIVGVAGGATRAAITQHQAIKNNMADVSAKDGSQETCVNLFASLVGILLLSLFGESSNCVWFLFFGATLLHLYSNYKAIKALNINQFNLERLNYVLLNYLRAEKISTPVETNEEESVILGFGLNSKNVCGYNIKIGESIEKIVKRKEIFPFELQLLTHVYKDKKYLLLTNLKHRIIYICLDKNYKPWDVIESYFHAFFHGICASYITNEKLELFGSSFSKNKHSILQKILKAAQNGKNDEGRNISRLDADVIIAVDNLAHQEMSTFLPALSKFGWNIEHNHLYVGEWRASWRVASESRKNR